MKDLSDYKTDIKEFLNNLDTSIDIGYLTDYNDFESFEELRDEIEEQNMFEQEVIYYSVAIKYLLDNDPSLNFSIGLAHDLGYTTENLNSELLATLLKTQEVRDEFYRLEDEVNTFFEELQEKIDEENED